MKSLSVVFNIDTFTVTPYVGVWIEILTPATNFPISPVTPYVGVWIEIPTILKDAKQRAGHPLCGGVD